MSYYNTTNEPSPQLELFQEKANHQEKAVLARFRQTPNTGLTASMVWVQMQHWPLTSIRRAFSDLTAAGLLEKTTDKAQGLYGKNEYRYKLTTP